ncbi:MAG: hypothetical protein ACREPQ_06055 [Rhodanobacter sp.]
MHTLFAHSVFWRVVSPLAGMLSEEIAKDTKPAGATACRELVTWSPGARSRREDELARSRQAESS